VHNITRKAINKCHSDPNQNQTQASERIGVFAGPVLQELLLSPPPAYSATPSYRKQ
jgi:hypothetical protein